MLLALVTAETAVVAKVLALWLWLLLLLLPLLLVRSLLASTIPSCALRCASISHWRSSVARRSITLRAAKVAGLPTVLTCALSALPSRISSVELTSVLRIERWRSGETARCLRTSR
jgi:hypothetical protein